MIAKAIDRIIQLAGPKTMERGGVLYASGNLTRIDTDLVAEPIRVTTLTGLLDFMLAYHAAFDEWRNYFLHVRSEAEVALISGLNGDRKRETIMIAVANPPRLPVNRYVDNDEFLVCAQANIIQDEETDIALVLKFAGCVTSGTIASYKDDGVTQKATIKVGIASKADGIIPNPVLLRPYRTFVEAEQPSSRFVFRMQQGASSPQCAIFEADGGAWKNTAIKNVAKFLETSLKEGGIAVPVIA